MIPKRLRIGPHTVTIKAGKESSRLLRADEARGDSVPDDLVIRVDRDLAPSIVAEVVVHEALHCVWAYSGLRHLKDIDEEHVVTTLSPWLLGLLRDNPDLITMMLDDFD